MSSITNIFQRSYSGSLVDVVGVVEVVAVIVVRRILAIAVEAKVKLLSIYPTLPQ